MGCPFQSPAVGNQTSRYFVLIILHGTEQIRIERKQASYQNISRLLTPGMVPWCWSEAPDKIESIHNHNIVFSAIF